MDFKTLYNLFFTYTFTCFSLFSFADELMIVFDTPPPTNLGCYDTWVEDGFIFQILPSSQTSNCDPPQLSGYGLWVSSDIISLDVSSLGQINQIMIDGQGACYDCNFFNLLDNGVQVGSIDVELFNDPIYYNSIGNIGIDEFQFYGYEMAFNSITIKYTPDNSCPTQNIVNARSGDVYVDESCHGVILTAPDGNCYRVKVNNSGALVSEMVSCP